MLLQPMLGLSMLSAILLICRMNFAWRAHLQLQIVLLSAVLHAVSPCWACNCFLQL